MYSRTSLHTAALFVIAGQCGCFSSLLAESTHSFTKKTLSEHFWGEGATFIDANKDGKKDLACGPFIYLAPGFTEKIEIYPPTVTFDKKGADGAVEKVPGFEGALGVANAYSDYFFAFARDFNGDGWEDLLVLGFPGKWSAWFENPKGGKQGWTKHTVLRVTDNESPTFTDITGDGVPEIVCSSNGVYGYAAPESASAEAAAAPWKWHAISPNNSYGKFTHGMGVGDINGDKRPDLIEKDGWWEQPASLAGDPVWAFHAFSFNSGGAQMLVYDVNADGLADVITSQEAHGYGLAWFEQKKNAEGIIGFEQHMVMNKSPEENKYGLSFGEMHALDLVDIDGDGLQDVVTGKRFWSHGAKADTKSATVAPLYWFQLKRSGTSVDFVPHEIDGTSGVGVQVVASLDWNADGLPDIAIGNKRGAFVFTHEKK